MKKVFKWIGLVLLGLFILGVIVDATKSPEEKAAQQAAREQMKADEQAALDKKNADELAAKAATEAACRSDLQCIGDQGTITAGIKCPKHIERLAKGAVKWTDGTLEPKFSSFRWKDKKAGIVTHIGDKAQFQNGYGAFINVIYTCDLDMRQNPGEVVNVGVSEGRL